MQLSSIPRIDTSRNTVVSYDVPLGEHGHVDMISVSGKVCVVSLDTDLLARIKTFLGTPEPIVDIAGKSRQFGGMLGFFLEIQSVNFTKAGADRLGKMLRKGLDIKTQCQHIH